MSGVKVTHRQTWAEIIHIHIMVSEQTNAIVREAAEATRAAIQAMAAAGAERTQNTRPAMR